MTLQDAQQWYNGHYKYFNQNGYLLALHGSLMKHGSGDDIDVIVVPYVKNPRNVHEVVRHVFPTAKQHNTENGILFIAIDGDIKIDILVPHRKDTK